MHRSVWCIFNIHAWKHIFYMRKSCFNMVYVCTIMFKHVSDSNSCMVDRQTPLSKGLDLPVSGPESIWLNSKGWQRHAFTSFRTRRTTHNFHDYRPPWTQCDPSSTLTPTSVHARAVHVLPHVANSTCSLCVGPPTSHNMLTPSVRRSDHKKTSRVAVQLVHDLQR